MGVVVSTSVGSIKYVNGFYSVGFWLHRLSVVFNTWLQLNQAKYKGGHIFQLLYFLGFVLLS